jgi:hypothetical protein
LRLCPLYYGPNPRPTMQQIKAFVRRDHVDRIVALDPGDYYPTGDQMHAFGRFQVLGDVFVAPPCGYDSFAGHTRRIPGQ